MFLLLQRQQTMDSSYLRKMYSLTIAEEGDERLAAKQSSKWTYLWVT